MIENELKTEEQIATAKKANKKQKKNEDISWLRAGKTNKDDNIIWLENQKIQNDKQDWILEN